MKQKKPTLKERVDRAIGKVYCQECGKWVTPSEINPVLRVCPDCHDKI